MERTEQHIDVHAPLRAVYDQWTQFEEFPRFMDGVEQVTQLDDAHVRWHVKIWGQDAHWDAEITEQQPDRRISWKSVAGAHNAGTVRFEPLDAHATRIHFAMAYDPHGLLENAGDALGLIKESVERTLLQFKTFIEERGRETGGWRGEIHDSAVKV